ncbi:hypothetical protein SprV_0200676100 [Sparganum proliferum]
MISGLVGGVACVYVGQPMDTIKVKMQTFPELHKNAFACIKNIWVKEGIVRGFYAGTLPALSGGVSENVVLFTAMPFCQRIVMRFSGKDSIKDLSLLELATAGSCCGFFTSLVMCPNELIKCKMQSSREVAQCTRTAVLQTHRCCLPVQWTPAHTLQDNTSNGNLVCRRRGDEETRSLT